MQLTYLKYEAPIGLIYVVMNEEGICKLSITEEDWQKYQQKKGEILEYSGLNHPVNQQLDEYFQGKRRDFNLPLVIEGTQFYKQVWQALQSIPYGQVRSYAEIAKAVGKPKGPRAIGQANRANPLPIFIPCHRVIGKDGKMIGYSGTRTDIKKFLLQLEKAIS